MSQERWRNVEELFQAAGGFHSEQEVTGLPGARRIEEMGVVPGPSPDVYAFYRGNTQRNLYRIPIP